MFRRPVFFYKSSDQIDCPVFCSFLVIHSPPTLLSLPTQTSRNMKITALLSLAVAVLAISEATPVARRPHSDGHAVPLTRRENFRHNTPAQIRKLNARYPQLQIKAGSTGSVPLTDVSPDLEYYGSVNVGTPAQVFKLDFDTVRRVKFVESVH